MRSLLLIIFGGRLFCKKSEKTNLSNICTVLCVRSFRLAIQDDASSKKLSKQKRLHYDLSEVLLFSHLIERLSNAVFLCFRLC